MGDIARKIKGHLSGIKDTIQKDSNNIALYIGTDARHVPGLGNNNFYVM